MGVLVNFSSGLNPSFGGWTLHVNSSQCVSADPGRQATSVAGRGVNEFHLSSLLMNPVILHLFLAGP